ncbi:MAG: hypothetical protein AAGD14_07680 [Planctomycetota bacterium]
MNADKRGWRHRVSMWGGAIGLGLAIGYAGLETIRWQIHPFNRDYVGKSETQALAILGPPTRRSSIASDEVLIWLDLTEPQAFSLQVTDSVVTRQAMYSR